MEDPAQQSARRPYFAYLFLAAATFWLLAIHRSKVSHEADAWLLSVMILTGLFIGFWLEWSVHGLLSAIGFSVLFLLVMPRESHTAIWPLQHLTIASGVGLVLVLCFELGRDNVRLAALAIAGAGIWLLDSFIWIEAAAAFGTASGAEVQCSRQVALALLSFGALLLLLCAAIRSKRKSKSHGSRRLILPVTMVLCAPVAGFALAQLWVHVPLHCLFTLDCWSEMGARRPLVLSTFLASDGSGYAGWLIATIVILGMWRTLGRGFRQLKKGWMPSSWLISLWLIMTVIPLHRLPANESLFLVLLGALLGVFVISDLLLLLFEQIALPIPPPGPSDVPHVPHP